MVIYYTFCLHPSTLLRGSFTWYVHIHMTRSSLHLTIYIPPKLLQSFRARCRELYRNFTPCCELMDVCSPMVYSLLLFLGLEQILLC